MNVHQNSIDAYHRIQENGLLAKTEFRVYDIIYRFGPLTSRMINDRLVAMYGGESNLNQTRGTITHLKDYGVIAERGNIKCPHSGMTVALYWYTDQLPDKTKKLTQKERKARALLEIEALGRATPDGIQKDKIRRIWNLVNRI